MPSAEPRPRGRGVWSIPRLVALLAIAALAGILVAGMALPVVGPVGMLARDSISSFEDLPRDFREPALPVRTRVYAADGTKIATIFDENRKEVPLSKVAPVMADAVVAIEDSRFFEHNGFDPRGFARAAVTNLTAGGVSQGGSTLTMQYVKNVLLTAATDEAGQAAAREDTITRKLREIRYAMAVEKRLTKEEILERYLNISYYGAKAYGVEAASQRYFSKKAKNLDLVEAATLAGIVQQPSRFDPTRNPKQSQARRDVVLNRMAELDYITVEEAREAKAQDVEDYLKPKIQYNGCTTSFAPYYCDFAIRAVQDLKALGKTSEDRAEAWRIGGYKVYTTLDVKAQDAAKKSVIEAIPPKDPSKKAVAIAMVTPGTGEVRALAQNREWGTGDSQTNWWETTYNYAVDLADGGTKGMQAGSTFKLFTLLAALDQGISPYTVIESPPSKTFTGFVGCEGNLLSDGGSSPWTVRNSTSSGNFDMFRGAAYSVNTFFVELQKRAGVCQTVEMARKLGVQYADGSVLGEVRSDGISAEVASFTLGSTEISPLTLANAYATVSAHGVYCKPRAITRIVDRNGKDLSVPAPKCKQAVSRNAADATAAVLTNVVDGGISGRTGGAMALGRDTTGKTGTIDNQAAVWFAGSTPDLSAAVWVGDPRGGYQHPLRNLTINGRYYAKVFGSSLPGPTWKNAMQGALAGSDPVPMELRNEWNLRPARQGGSPSQRAVPVAPSAPWWQRAYTGEGDRSSTPQSPAATAPPAGE
ncbi:MAG: transglycosylase domain-containing protein [Candidatus Nanopelagicales bacterium]